MATARQGFPKFKYRNRRGRGRQPKRGEMNSLERAYAEHLEVRRAPTDVFTKPTVLSWHFEAVKLKIAEKTPKRPATFYTPDFLVMVDDHSLEFHEVKGFWEDDALVKIKIAASMFPFKFIAVQRKPKRDGGGWLFEEF